MKLVVIGGEEEGDAAWQQTGDGRHVDAAPNFAVKKNKKNNRVPDRMTKT